MTQEVNNNESIDDEQKNSNEQEIVKEVTEEKSEMNNSENVSGTEESQEQINWKKFRESREKDRLEKIEIEKRVKQKEEEAEALKLAMETLLAKTNGSQNQNQTNNSEYISDEDYIKKLVDKEISSRTEREQQERQMREQQEMPQRLRQANPDFDHVCTSTNIDYLDYHFPEISKAFSAMPESYDKWDSVYKAVKKLVPNLDHEHMSKRAQENQSKPQSMNVAGTTTTQDTPPRMLDEERRMANWRRMQEEMKGG